MKLRNKNTGEIIESACIGVFKHQSSGDCERVDTEARSLEKVLEVWEDYKPKEPIIKAKDVRHILKQWARTNLIPSNSNEIEVCLIDSQKGTITQFYSDGLYIQFWGRVAPDAISGRCYTIDELCGEEKE